MRDAGRRSTTPTRATREAYPLQLARRVEAGDVAPYFVEWVRQQLEEQFGQQLYEQGLKVYTTLDVDLQSAAERALEQPAPRDRGGAVRRVSRTSTYEALHGAGERTATSSRRRNSPYLQGAFIAMDPRTGARARARRRPRLRRLQVQSRRPGAPPARLDVQADRLRRRDPERPPAVVHRSTTRRSRCRSPAARRGRRRTTTGSSKARCRCGARSISRATCRRSSSAWSSATQSVIDEARKFGITTPIPGYPSIFIGAADVYPIEMVAALLGVRDARHARAADRRSSRVEDQKGDVLWEPQPTRRR